MDSCDFYTTLGKKLRARRRTKHMTLSDLSKKLNKSVATISKYEKGEVLISIDTLVDICPDSEYRHSLSAPHNFNR